MFLVSSSLGLVIFSSNEAVWLRVLFVPLHSMSAGLVVSLKFKILSITGWPSFSWYNVSIISSHIPRFVCFSPCETCKPLSKKKSPGFLERVIIHNTTLTSTSQWFVLLGQVDISLGEKFPLEDDQQSFHHFGTSWWQSKRRNFPFCARNLNTRFLVDHNIFYSNENHVQLSKTQ